jgi:hypothetical protein
MVVEIGEGRSFFSVEDFVADRTTLFEVIYTCLAGIR